MAQLAGVDTATNDNPQPTDPQVQKDMLVAAHSRLMYQMEAHDLQRRISAFPLQMIHDAPLTVASLVVHAGLTTADVVKIGAGMQKGWGYLKLMHSTDGNPGSGDMLVPDAQRLMGAGQVTQRGHEADQMTSGTPANPSATPMEQGAPVLPGVAKVNAAAGGTAVQAGQALAGGLGEQNIYEGQARAEIIGGKATIWAQDTASPDVKKLEQRLKTMGVQVEGFQAPGVGGQVFGRLVADIGSGVGKAFDAVGAVGHGIRDAGNAISNHAGFVGRGIGDAVSGLGMAVDAAGKFGGYVAGGASDIIGGGLQSVAHDLATPFTHHKFLNPLQYMFPGLTHHGAVGTGYGQAVVDSLGWSRTHADYQQVASAFDFIGQMSVGKIGFDMAAGWRAGGIELPTTDAIASDRYGGFGDIALRVRQAVSHTGDVADFMTKGPGLKIAGEWSDIVKSAPDVPTAIGRLEQLGAPPALARAIGENGWDATSTGVAMNEFYRAAVNGELTDRSLLTGRITEIDRQLRTLDPATDANEITDLTAQRAILNAARKTPPGEIPTEWPKASMLKRIAGGIPFTNENGRFQWASSIRNRLENTLHFLYSPFDRTFTIPLGHTRAERDAFDKAFAAAKSDVERAKLRADFKGSGTRHLVVTEPFNIASMFRKVKSEKLYNMFAQGAPKDALERNLAAIKQIGQAIGMSPDKVSYWEGRMTEAASSGRGSFVKFGFDFHQAMKDEFSKRGATADAVDAVARAFKTETGDSAYGRIWDSANVDPKSGFITDPKASEPVVPNVLSDGKTVVERPMMLSETAGDIPLPSLDLIMQGTRLRRTIFNGTETLPGWLKYVNKVSKDPNASFGRKAGDIIGRSFTGVPVGATHAILELGKFGFRTVLGVPSRIISIGARINADGLLARYFDPRQGHAVSLFRGKDQLIRDMQDSGMSEDQITALLPQVQGVLESDKHARASGKILMRDIGSFLNEDYRRSGMVDRYIPEDHPFNVLPDGTTVLKDGVVSAFYDRLMHAARDNSDGMPRLARHGPEAYKEFINGGSREPAGLEKSKIRTEGELTPMYDTGRNGGTFGQGKYFTYTDNKARQAEATTTSVLIPASRATTAEDAATIAPDIAQSLDENFTPTAGKAPKVVQQKDGSWKVTLEGTKGARRTPPSYLDVRSPFDFSQKLQQSVMERVLRTAQARGMSEEAANALRDAWAAGRKKGGTPLTNVDLYNAVNGELHQTMTKVALDQAGYDGIIHDGGVMAFDESQIHPGVNDFIGAHAGTQDYVDQLRAASLDEAASHSDGTPLTDEEWVDRAYKSLQLERTGQNDSLMHAIANGNVWYRRGDGIFDPTSIRRLEGLRKSLQDARDALAEGRMSGDKVLIKSLQDKVGELRQQVADLGEVLGAQSSGVIALSDRAAMEKAIEEDIMNGSIKLPPVVARRIDVPDHTEVGAARLSDGAMKFIYQGGFAGGKLNPMNWMSGYTRLLTRMDRHARLTAVEEQFRQEFERLKSYGYSNEDAAARANVVAANFASDYFYNLGARTPMQHSLENIFYYLPVGQAELRRWFIDIPRQYYWPVGIMYMANRVSLVSKFMTEMGWIQKNPTTGQWVSKLPFGHEILQFLFHVAGGKGELPSSTGLTFDPRQVEGLITDPSITFAPNPLLTTAAGVLSNHTGLFKATTQALDPYFAQITNPSVALTHAYEAFFGHPPFWARGSLAVQSAMFDSAYINAQRIARATLDARGIQPPPNHYLSDGKVNPAWTTYTDEWKHETDAIYRGVAFWQFVGSFASPFNLYLNDPVAQEYQQYYNNVISKQKTPADIAKAKADWIVKHPNDWAYTIPKSEANNANLGPTTDVARYYQQVAEGKRTVFTPDQFMTYAMGKQSTAMLQHQLDQAMSQAGITDWRSYLLNSWSRGALINKYEDEYNQFLATNPEYKTMLMHEQSVYAGQKGGYPVQSTQAQKLIELHRLLGEFLNSTAVGGIRSNDGLKVMAQISQKLASEYVGPPNKLLDQMQRNVQWWYNEVAGPYYQALSPWYTKAQAATAAGQDATKFYNQIRDISANYYFHPQMGPDGQPAPNPEQVSWGAKTQQEQQVALAKWASEPVTWLDPFQLEKVVGQPITEEQFNVLTNIAKQSETWQKALAASPYGSSSTYKSELDQAIQNYGAQQTANDPVLSKLWQLNAEPPGVKLMSLGIIKDPTMQGFIQKASQISNLLTAAGYSPTDSSGAVGMYKEQYLYQAIDKAIQQDPSGPFADEMAQMGEALGTGGAFVWGPALYDKLFFNYWGKTEIVDSKVPPAPTTTATSGG